jgi:DNA-binding transcriptional ArsR family regulator
MSSSPKEEALLSHELWPEGRKILAALKKSEDEGKSDIPSDVLAAELGLTPGEVVEHMRHLEDGAYVACRWDIGSTKCWATLTDVGRAMI